MDKQPHSPRRLLWTLAFAIGAHALLLLFVTLPPGAPAPKPPLSVVIELQSPSSEAQDEEAVAQPSGGGAPRAPSPPKAQRPAPRPRAVGKPPPDTPIAVPEDIPSEPAPNRPSVAALPSPEGSDPEGTDSKGPNPLEPAPEGTPVPLARRLFPEPTGQRARDLLLNPGGGTGPVTGQALQERVQGLAALDAQVITAQHREAMGVTHPHVTVLSDALKGAFDPELEEIKAMGIPSRIRSEQGLPDHMEKQLAMIAENGGMQSGSLQGSLAAAAIQGSRCDYGYYSLGWLSMRLSPTGELLGAAIYRSSGSAAMDQRLLALAQELAPFGSLPEEALSADGSFRGTWEFGYRDYAQGGCIIRGEDGPLRFMSLRFRGNFY